MLFDAISALNFAAKIRREGGNMKSGTTYFRRKRPVNIKIGKYENGSIGKVHFQ
jgi:hypothetical protein